MRRSLLVCALLCLVVPGGATALRAEEPPPTSDRTVPEHDIAVRLSPRTGRLVARDRVAIPPRDDAEIRLDLNPALEVLELKIDGEVQAERARAEDGAVIVPWTPENRTVEIHYAGVIQDAVKAADDLTWVVGDGTTGVISEQGVYLSGASRWVPRVRGEDRARFHVTSWIPSPFLVVTDGGLPERGTAYANPGVDDTNLVQPGPHRPEGAERGERTWNVAACKATQPTDGLSLAAGRWVTKSRTVKGVRIATFFHESEAGAQDLWLAEAARTVERYVPILGAYPHPRFDIVSNFFQTGYGMPGWTLLGDRVIRYVTAKARRSGQIPPGYLDHEYVHGWYGNGILVDYETGNWCEGLTTYLANYYAKELESAEAARAHRLGVLEKLAVRVTPAVDYPVVEFRSKTEEKDNDIGYGKASLIFHGIRRVVGDEAFAQVLRECNERWIGRRVTWEEWIAAFGKVYPGLTLKSVSSYLLQKGLPRVAIRGVIRQTRAADGAYALLLSLERHGALAAFTADVRLTLENGDVQDHTLALVDERPVLEVDTPSPVVRIDVDPDAHLLRQIPAASVPVCLQRTLLQPVGEVVVANHPKVFAGVAARLRAHAFPGTAQADPAAPRHRVVLEVADTAQTVNVVGATHVKTLGGPEIAVLTTTRQDDGTFETRYTANSPAAAARAGYMSYYGWDTWVIFKNGIPVARGVERPDNDELTWVAEAPDAPKDGDGGDGGALARIEADVEQLCHPDFAGRRTGTEGAARMRRWLATRMAPHVEAGALGHKAPPLMTQRVPVGVRDALGEVHRTPVRALGDVTLPKGIQDGTPMSMSPGGTFLVDTRKIRVLAGAEPADLAAQVSSLRLGELLIVETPLDAKAPLSPWAHTPRLVTSLGRKAWARTDRRGREQPKPVLEPWIAGRRSRGPRMPDAAAPVLAVSDVAPWQDLASGPPGRIEVQINWDPDSGRAESHTILGGRVQTGALPPFKGDVPPETRSHIRKPVILLMAHHDGLGVDGDRVFPGADDNASGVACVLEVLRRVAARWSDAPRDMGLVVAFTDAEEWGLLGARALVDWLKSGVDVRAVINVDAVGRAASKPEHVLGLSKHPELAATLTPHLESAGLTLGKDIDRFAYAHGSDHWPFHEAGIPALSLWASDYRVMNTPADTPEKVEPAGIARLADALTAYLLSR